VIAAASIVGAGSVAVMHAQTTHSAMNMRYFRDVVSSRNPDARYSLTLNRASQTYSFHDKATNADFRDGAQIVADAGKLWSSAARSPTTGTTRYVWSKAFASLDSTLGTCYLTPGQIDQAGKLTAEMKAYNSLIADSPSIISGGDIAHIAMSPATEAQPFPKGQPVVEFDLTPAGTAKLSAFTASHIGDKMALIVDGRVVIVPNIAQSIKSSRIDISGGFRNPADAQSVVDEINHSHD
jgi:hypothetical protein